MMEIWNIRRKGNLSGKKGHMFWSLNLSQEWNTRMEHLEVWDWIQGERLGLGIPSIEILIKGWKL